jgi:putative oxidoreductase
MTYWGIRASVGVIFIAYGLQKFDPIWREHLIGFGLPPELQIPIALAETIGGIALIIGVLTRVTGAIFSIILVDAIFHIRWENGFFIAKGGWDYDLALLAMVLFIIVVGSGSISVSYKLKKLPKLLQ